MVEKLYFLDAVRSPWGDYGSILQDGMTTHQTREKGLLRLERTGPIIYPITFPFHIVVTQDFLNMIEKSDLTGFKFKRVIKHHIVELNWEEWDFTTGEPHEYPETGEPEDYILGQPHSSSAAAALGDLWEMILKPGVDITRSKIGSETNISLIPNTWNGTDLFHARTTTISCISSKARDWFNRHFADYVSIRSDYLRASDK